MSFFVSNIADNRPRWENNSQPPPPHNNYTWRAKDIYPLQKITDFSHHFFIYALVTLALPYSLHKMLFFTINNWEKKERRGTQTLLLLHSFLSVSHGELAMSKRMPWSSLRPRTRGEEQAGYLQSNLTSPSCIQYFRVRILVYHTQFQKILNEYTIPYPYSLRCSSLTNRSTGSSLTADLACWPGILTLSGGVKGDVTVLHGHI